MTQYMKKCADANDATRMKIRKTSGTGTVAVLLGSVLALVSGLAVRAFVAEPRTVVSNSMEPTLEVGDYLMIDKLSYRLRPPRVGEIVVFETPEVLTTRGAVMVKRVVAVEAQRVEVKDGAVLVADVPLVEPYLSAPPSYEWGPRTVPSGSVFVLGDHRNGSADSHVWGFLPLDRIVGRAVFRVLPLSRAGRLNQ